MAFETKADFDKFYGRSAEVFGKEGPRPAIRLGYHWFLIGQYQRNHFAPMLASLCGLSALTPTAVIGAGFGWTAEGLAALGVPVVATDVSPYIIGASLQNENAEIDAAIAAAGLDPATAMVIGPDYVTPVLARTLFRRPDGGSARTKISLLNEDLSNVPSRRRVAQSLNNTISAVVTEEMLNSISDSAIVTALSRLESLRGSYAHPLGCTVYHMLSPLQTYASQDPSLNWKTYAGWRAFLNANGFSSHRIVPTVTAYDQGMTLGVDPVNGMARQGCVFAYSGLI